jgi:hypothetical protein
MPSRYTPPSTRNIRRIDSPKSHGYQVHIERNGQVITKHFSDSHYPSPAKARKAAMEYRDRLLAELPPPQAQQGFRTRAHSNTGEVGISLTYMARKSGEKKPYITASVSPEPGKMVGRKFSVEQYGYEGAIAEAKAWRDGVLRERLQRLEHQRRKEQRRRARSTSPAAEPAAAFGESQAAPPRRRGRPRKQAVAPEAAAVTVEATPPDATAEVPPALIETPRRGRGRPRKQR